MQNKLYLGDCLNIMSKLKSHSFDMILCDLPYGVTALKWDKRINLFQLGKQYERLLKPDGVIALTATQPFTTDLIIAFGNWFKYTWTWIKNKPTGFQHAKNQPLRYTEDICIFSPAAIKHNSMIENSNHRMKFNPQGVKISIIKKVSSASHGRFLGERLNQVGKEYQSYTNYPSNVLYYESVNNCLVSTQKPLELFTYLIETYTDKGDLILDNCIGSGTTAIAAMKTERYVVGIEKDPEIFEICKNRIFNYKAHEADIMNEENISHRVEEFLASKRG